MLVLEQHDVAGGNTHTFVEKGFEMDTGVHYLYEHDFHKHHHPSFVAVP